MLAVATCHFNWAGYHTPVRNLARFLREMKETGVEVYGVELYLHGTIPRMLKNPNWLKFEVDQRSILFQKERLMNLVVEKLIPPGFDKIACLDHDIHFTNKDWVQDIETALDRYKVIQPFEDCFWTDRLGNRHLRRHTCVKMGINDKWTGHPGFGWAMRRDFFEQVGLYDYAVLGSGDTAFACALLDSPLIGCSVRGIGIPQQVTGLYESYKEKLQQYVNGQVGWIPGSVIHEWHGDYQARNYFHRAEIVKDFDALKDLALHRNGYWHWTDQAPSEMVQAISDHFKNRKEDG